MYIKWKAVMDATGYTLVIEEKKQQGNQPPEVTTVEEDFYIKNDLKPWTTYCVSLAAKNTTNQSDFSEPICKTTATS